MADGKKLTPKEERFVDAYLALDLNGTQAALKAGYAEASAKQQAYHILARPHIQDAIEAKRAEIKANIAEHGDYDLSAEAVARERAKMAYSNMDDFVVLAGGLPRFDFTRVTRAQMAAVSEITVDTRREAGEDGDTIDKVRFKLHSKAAALDAIDKQFGHSKPTQFDINDISDKPSAEDIAKRTVFLMRKAQAERKKAATNEAKADQ